MYKPLENLKKNRKRRKILLRFLRGLTHRKVKNLDGKAMEATKEAYTKIDCLKCANCCKTMNPTWKKTEIKRVANHLGMKYSEYFKKYLVLEKGDIMNRKTPCQHLNKDNTCSIYEIRPSDCEGFPHTQNREFKLYIAETHLQNMDYCPITVEVVKNIYKKVMAEKGEKNDLL